MDIPNLGEDCFHEAINPQFQYETQASLEKALHREYGNVRCITTVHMPDHYPWEVHTLVHTLGYSGTHLNSVSCWEGMACTWGRCVCLVFKSWTYMESGMNQRLYNVVSGGELCTACDGSS